MKKSVLDTEGFNESSTMQLHEIYWNLAQNLNAIFEEWL